MYNKSIINFLLFWLHVIFIVLAILSGLILSPWVVISLAILHRLHVIFFRGCLLSRLQNWVGGLPLGVNFLQAATKKLFKKEISLAQSQKLDYFFASLAIVIALAK